MIDITPIVRLYSKLRSRQLKKQNVSDIQKFHLLKLLRKAESTRFGRQYDFSRIRTVERYQRTVPLRTYEDFWHDFWGRRFPKLTDCTWPGKIPFFAITTGTTKKSKNIPLTEEMIRSNSKASFDLFGHHVANRPQSRIFGGKGYMTGNANLRQLSHDVCAGPLPDILIEKTMPRWIRPWYFSPSEKLAAIQDSEERISRFVRELLGQDLRSMSGFPPMLLVLFRKLEEIKSLGRPFRVTDYFPNLEMIVHGGVSMTPYLKQFSDFIERSRCELREVYASSEGFIAIADRNTGQGLRLICDHGIFYEFVPIDELYQDNPSRYWIENVRTGKDYAIVISTCAGLWSYILGDTVRFVELNPPRILMTGRTSNTLSIFGEKFLEEEISRAVAAAADAIGAAINDFTSGESHPLDTKDQGRHIYVVEFRNTPRQEDILRFTDTLDHILCLGNRNYSASRVENLGLDSPELVIAAPGAFKKWLENRGKPGGKIPRIISDSEAFDALLKFVQDIEIQI